MQITIIRICIDFLSGGAIIHPTEKNHYRRKAALFSTTTLLMNDTEKKTANRNHDPAGKLQPEPSRLSTDRLFNGARELIIEHAGEAYRLRITSKGKLILTK